MVAAAIPQVDYASGVLEEQRGEDAKAGALFEKAVAEDPLALPLVEKVVGDRLKKGDRDGALELYRNLAVKSPERLEVQLRYGEFMESQGGAAEAVALYEKELEKYPGETVLIGKLLHLRRDAGERDAVVELLGKLRAEDPEAVLMYASGMESVYDGDDVEARRKVDERFEEGFKAHPDDRVLARAASEHFRTSGRMDEAIAILDTHVAAAPSSLELMTRLGVLYFSAGRDDEGVEILKRVVEIRPKSVLAHRSLAKYYRLEGDEERAREHGAEVLKIRGGSEREFLILADEFLDAGDARAARLLLERAVFDHPGKLDLAMKLAIATRRDPETRDRAGRLFREAEAVMPEGMALEPAFLVESADVLREEGQGSAAEERLRNAIKGYPRDAKKEMAAALRKLAGWWEEQGKNAEAAKALRKRADGLDPE